MRKYLMIAAISFSLVGCTALTGVATNMLGGGKSISANAQVGEEANQQVIAGDQNKTETHVEADTANVTNSKQEGASVTGDVRKLVINNTGVPLYVWLICILGWMLPSPSEMWNRLSRRN